MLKDITIGQYYPADTAVHRMDPRLKILTMFAFIVSIFFVKSYWVYGMIFAYLALVVFTSKLPPKMVLKGLKPLRWILLLTFLVNLLFTPGTVLWQWKFLKVTEEGIHQSIMMAIRLVLLVTGTSLLTLTTSPIELTDGIERLLAPLKVIGVPAHELAMMMTIALRFIPTLIEETDKIMKAQMARGADFETGNLITRAKNLIPLLVPLFIDAFHRAEELGAAMEARCYHGGEGRTKLNPLHITTPDVILFVGSLAFFIGVIFLGILR